VARARRGARARPPSHLAGAAPRDAAPLRARAGQRDPGRSLLPRARRSHEPTRRARGDAARARGPQCARGRRGPLPLPGPRALAGPRARPAARSTRSDALPRPRRVARRARAAGYHVDLPRGVHEQPRVDVRAHTAPPRRRRPERPPQPARLRHRLHRQLRGGRRPRVHGAGYVRALPGLLRRESLLPQARALRRLAEPRHLGVPARPRHGRGRVRAAAPLGARRRRHPLLLLPPELLLPAPPPARGSPSGAAPAPGLSGRRDSGGHRARRDRADRRRRRGALPPLARDGADHSAGCAGARGAQTGPGPRPRCAGARRRARGASRAGGAGRAAGSCL